MSAAAVDSDSCFLRLSAPKRLQARIAGMKILVLLGHPQRGSFNHALAETAVATLELNGALSNPQLAVEFGRLCSLHDDLLLRATVDPRQPRPAPIVASSILKSVSLLLERSERPMRAREIHAAACELAGRPLLWSTVRSALSVGVKGDRPRFRRLAWGVYEIAGFAKQVAGPL
jgi:hypothetical protein